MERKFGEVSLKIIVVPSNKDKLTDTIKEEILDNPYAVAFKGNPILTSIKQLDTIVMGTITYVVFENVVVQYYNDNLYDINGMCSTLYQEIAKKVFKENINVHFCTELINMMVYKNNLNINDYD